jgi:hypothetical protein
MLELIQRSVVTKLEQAIEFYEFMDPEEHSTPSVDGNGQNNPKKIKPNPNKDNKPNKDTACMDRQARQSAKQKLTATAARFAKAAAGA